MEAPRPIVTGADPRRLQLVIAVLVVVIVALVIRPWSDGVHRPAPGPVTRPSRSAAVASPAKASDGPAAGHIASSTVGSTNGDTSFLRVSCGSPDGWRATTVQQWPDRALPVRSWIAIEPVPASTPLDPAIPLAPVAADVVTAIGYCAPLEARLQPPAGATASLWAVGRGVASRLTPVPLDPTSLFRQGALWLPPPELMASSPGHGDAHSWPPGRYVIEIRAPARQFDRWLGLEILDLAPAGPSNTAPPASSTPGETPGATPPPPA